MIDLNAILARLGSLSPNARKRIANANATALRLLTVDMPALIAELAAYRAAEVKP